MLKRFIVGVFKTLTLRVIPLILVMGILWSGYQVAGAVSRQLDERNQYESIRDQFSSTATLIAQLIPTETFTPSPTATFTATATPTATFTPTATATATYTLEPTATQTATTIPTETPMPPTATPTDLPTETPTEAVIEVAQAVVFATNTPRAVIFVTNTPIGATGSDSSETVVLTDEPTVTAIPTDIPTDVLTQAPTATDIPTSTPSPTIEPTAEPTLEPTATVVVEQVSVLPTPLLPQGAQAGAVINGVEVPSMVDLVQRDYNLVNIILLGTDEALHDSGYALTDTMIIVSINRDTGTVNMLHLPRDLYVYIPTTNGMMQRLNVAYGVGESIGWTGGGFGLLRQTIFYNFGINVHYYAKVDFDGFRDIVDMLGGVNIAVDCAYEDYPLIGTELPDGVRRSTEDGLRVLDVGYYEMNGAQALWYARTRRTSSDFDRGRRQQQLLRAIWHKARQSVSLTNAPELWSQGIEIVETDITLTEVINFGLLPLALNLDFSRIESFSMIPTYHTYSLTVDGANVQAINYETMRQLMSDFYRPPADAQLLQRGATITVYNGTDNHLWDWVATDRLQWEGYAGSAGGISDGGVVPNTIIIDHTGQQKGSSLSDLVRLLNIRAENVVIEPNPSRTSDFTVIVGQDYNSCNVSGVLPVNR